MTKVTKKMISRTLGAPPGRKKTQKGVNMLVNKTDFSSLL